MGRDGKGGEGTGQDVPVSDGKGGGEGERRDGTGRWE